VPVDSQLETTIAERRQSGDTARAAELLIRGYGAELYSYLNATLDDADADDAFGMFCEDVWRGMSTYRGESTFRTWAYAVARGAASRLRRSEGRRQRRFRSGIDGVEAIADDVRKTTAAFRRTAVKDRFRQLREELPKDDQELLILRVDRELDWREIAAIVSGADDDVTLDKEAALLRKRFERVKEKLKRRAEKAGLM
jgi:RNA polymerase sigma-70 factor, ECF subfamily